MPVVFMYNWNLTCCGIGLAFGPLPLPHPSFQVSGVGLVASGGEESESESLNVGSKQTSQANPVAD